MSEWITLTSEELAEFLPKDTSQELLLNLAENISGSINVAKASNDKRRKQIEVYKELTDAKKHLTKAMECLRNAENSFDPGTYRLFIDDREGDLELAALLETARSHKGEDRKRLFDEAVYAKSQQHATLKHRIDQIEIFIPKRKPKPTDKKATESLFESLHLCCERAKPDMGWYSRDNDYGGHKGDFFLLCKLASEKAGVYISDSTIHKYIRTGAKPSREKMKQVFKNAREKFGDKCTDDQFYEEMDKVFWGTRSKKTG